MSLVAVLFSGLGQRTGTRRGRGTRSSHSKRSPFTFESLRCHGNEGTFHQPLGISWSPVAPRWHFKPLSQRTHNNVLPDTCRVPGGHTVTIRGERRVKDTCALWFQQKVRAQGQEMRQQACLGGRDVD